MHQVTPARKKHSLYPYPLPGLKSHLEPMARASAASREVITPPPDPQRGTWYGI